MGEIALSSLLALPVRMHGIQLGRPVDVLVDERGERVVGLELLCGDGARRFLPFAVADIRPDEIAVESALMLLDERDLDYYRARTRRLADTPLADAWIDGRGTVRSRTAA
ncbi:MAG TPA: PRC-barrel domain-containing protein [Gaiellaceae bacterium]|nr:PRC-barrel domain-containing protein [Gaiellaceae bacterium]